LGRLCGGQWRAWREMCVGLLGVVRASRSEAGAAVWGQWRGGRRRCGRRVYTGLWCRRLVVVGVGARLLAGGCERLCCVGMCPRPAHVSAACGGEWPMWSASVRADCVGAAVRVRESTRARCVGAGAPVVCAAAAIVVPAGRDVIAAVRPGSCRSSCGPRRC
jgi:hypothetical protein